MRILQIVECPAGGVLRYLIDLCKALDKEGAEIILVYSIRSETPADLPTFFPKNISFHHVEMCREVSFWTDMRALVTLRQFFKEVKPDIVHAHSSKAGFLARLATRLSNVRTVFYTPHGYSFLRSDVSQIKRKFYLLLERMASVVGGVTVASSAMELEQAKKYKLGKTIGLYHAVPVFKSETDGGLKEQSVVAPLIGTSGRISPQKNPLNFLKVCCEIKKMLPAARFIWFGDGELREELESKSQIMGLEVSITGWLQAQLVIEEMASLDLYVHTALWEAWPPYTVLEAMSLGIPVVAMRVPGVTDDVSGSIDLAIAPKSIAHKAVEILSDSAIWSEKALRGLDVIRNEYSMEEFNARVKEIYTAR